MLDDPAALARVVEALLRADAWNIGIGIGEVESRSPTTRGPGAARRTSHAREAVTAAKNSPWHLRVAGDDPGVRALETTLWLWAAVLARRTAAGLGGRRPGRRGRCPTTRPARRLGISQSAVSQRAQAAGIVEGRRARELATELPPTCSARRTGAEA